MENRDFTCHGKNMGVWSSGTLSGATTTNSNNSPSNNGTTPINRNATRMHLDAYKNILERSIKDKYIQAYFKFCSLSLYCSLLLLLF